MSKIQLIATAPMGLEAVVAKEIRDLGYEDMQVENGRVVFAADESAICRCNLWLRSSNRLLIKMGEFPARTFDELLRTGLITEINLYRATGLKPKYQKSYFDYTKSLTTGDLSTLDVDDE